VLSEKFSKILPEHIKLEKKMTVEARKIKLKAMGELYQIYKKLSDMKENVRKLSLSQPPPSEAEAATGGKKKKKKTLEKVPSQPVELRVQESYQVGEPITVTFKTIAEHNDTDWVGLYPADVPSMPGHSNGRWSYVPPGSEGQVTFSFEQLPPSSGVFEVRYHKSNGYEVLAATPFQILETESDLDELSPQSAKRSLLQGTQSE